MLKAITWGQFAGWLFLALVVYYAYIGAVYYRAELLGFGKGKGKGKAPGTAPIPALATGPLIRKPAVEPTAPPVKRSQPAATSTTEQETDNEEDNEEEAAEENRPVAAAPVLSDINLAPQANPAPSLATTEPNATIGIAQLGDYLGRAASGQVTQEQLVKQAPELANTALLLAFFQQSTQHIQRTTTQLYAGVEEPALAVA